MKIKIPIFLFLIIILIPFFSAVNFGISPGTIKISEKTNEVVCKNFTLMGEDNYVFNGDVKWSNEKSKNILAYTIPSEQFKIDVEIPSGIKAGQYQICISSERGGNYSGALMYKLENSSYGIGTWIELNVEGKDFFSVTGNVINNFGNEKLFLLSPLLLLIILFFLLRKLKRKKTEFQN